MVSNEIYGLCLKSDITVNEDGNRMYTKSKIRYVGRSYDSDNRFQDHLNEAQNEKNKTKLHNWINKIGAKKC
jgi:hypothetical protein